MKDSLIKLKTYFLYGLLGFVPIFCLLWLADTLSKSFNPEYKPLLWFLQIVNDLLRTIIGM